MPHLALYLLGPMLVTLDERPVTAFEYDKVRALLAYLAAESDRPHRREALTGLLWADLPEASARTNLRQALATLRRAIADPAADPPFLHIDRASIQWNREADSWLDLTELLTLLNEAEHHSHRHAGQCRPCADRLERAVALYRGPFLSQFSLADSTEFEEWALLKREWIHHRLLEALSRLVLFHEQRGAYKAAIRFARRQLEMDPWREVAHRDVMRLLVLHGERHAALEQYAQCRHVLAEGLGVEPEAETTLLYEAIRDESPDAPVAISRLSTRTPYPHNLPPPTTPFIGRERELTDLTTLLDNPICRLVTIVGIGGVGKSRLALQAATAQLDTFADGVFWIPLAGLNVPERLARVIGETMGLSFSGSGTAESHLLDFLKAKEILLVLDNFEHLLQAVTLLARLLSAAPRLTLLVTSRERLHLQGEWLLELGGMELPPSDASSKIWEHTPAVQLFLQSALRVGTHFPETIETRKWIEHICKALDGLPLGIELAAAWSRLLSLEDMAREIEQDLAFLTSSLQDVPLRHRSLQAVFDHSWRLLSGAEQQVLSQLALFRGGFRRDAATQIAGATLPLLSALLDKSLLRRHVTGRYDLHELVRQYAWHRLVTAGEIAPARKAFLNYFVDLAEQAEPQFTGPEQGQWLATIEAEHQNIQAAFEYALAEGEAEAGLRLAVALYRYWHWRTFVDEGRHWLEVMVSATEPLPTLQPLRARAYHAAGVMAVEQGEYGAATALLEQALSLRRMLGDTSGEAGSLNSLGVIAWERGNYTEAQQFYEESLALRRQLGQPHLLSGPLNNLGLVALARKDYDTAQAALEEALAIDRELQFPTAIASILLNLGTLMLDRGELVQAQAYFQESLDLHWQLGEKDGVAYCLEGTAGILAIGTDTESAAKQAAQLFGAAARIRRETHMPLSPTERVRYDHHCDMVRAVLSNARFEEAWGEGERLLLAEAITLASSLLKPK